MSGSVDTPILIILFNRPERVRELIGALRRVRPSRVLVAADGPRDGHPDDRRACADARSVLDDIDWPCTIEREFASSNLGCDQRYVSALDWAFSLVERAIVLEDDIVPEESFFPWVAAMLDRFADDQSVAMISGRNPLGRWGVGQHDHLRARRGKIWGWATTAQKWRQTKTCELGGEAERAYEDAARLGADPVVAKHFGIVLRSYRRGEPLEWCVIYALRNYIQGGAAIVSPVNLVANNGIGPGATHTLFADDFSQLIPVWAAPELASSPVSLLDEGYDRAALLVDLMAQCVNPPMARRLAIRLGRLPLGDEARHHLAPFTVPGESLELLEHLAAQGVSSPHFDLLMRTLREAAPATAGNP